jgi:hypothetical protein
VLIEALALFPLRRWSGIRRVAVPVLVGNAIGYLLLFAGFMMVFGRHVTAR